MTRYALPLGLLVASLSASVAFAHPIPNNEEPPAPVEQPSLQEILDDLVVSGPPIDANAPSGIQLFEPSGSPMAVQVLFDFVDSAPQWVFGMYEADDPHNMVWLITEKFAPNEVVNVTFGADGTISLDNNWYQTDPTGFDGPFGFFVKLFTFGERPTYFYSQPDLNGGTDRVKVFQGNNQSSLDIPGLDPALFLPDQFVLAWELGLGDGNDGGFDDLIVSIKTVLPVPEPATLLLLGISVGALARMRKARRY